MDWTLPKHAEKKTPDYKKMKILGSYVITQTDIVHRKSKAMMALKSNNKFFKANISNKLKIRIFECYVSSAFLYNSELWSLTTTQEKQIDAYHRKLLRYALNKQYPKKISNEHLYQITEVQPWSHVIKRRRMNTTGHVLRLPKTTPVQKALQEATKPAKRKRGHPRKTWLRTIEDNLKPEITATNPASLIKKLTETAQDRDVWRGVTRSVMSRLNWQHAN